MLLHTSQIDCNKSFSWSLFLPPLTRTIQELRLKMFERLSFYVAPLTCQVFLCAWFFFADKWKTFFNILSKNVY